MNGGGEKEGKKEEIHRLYIVSSGKIKTQNYTYMYILYMKYLYTIYICMVCVCVHLRI